MTGRQEAETGTQKGIMTRAGWLRFLERCSQRQRGGGGGEGTTSLVSGRLRMKSVVLTAESGKKTPEWSLIFCCVLFQSTCHDYRGWSFVLASLDTKRETLSACPCPRASHVRTQTVESPSESCSAGLLLVYTVRRRTLLTAGAFTVLLLHHSTPTQNRRAHMRKILADINTCAHYQWRSARVCRLQCLL